MISTLKETRIVRVLILCGKDGLICLKDMIIAFHRQRILDAGSYDEYTSYRIQVSINYQLFLPLSLLSTYSTSRSYVNWPSTIGSG
jgi:hypothetical protein